ncbi:MAG: hypothetical protein HC866_17860 [Leptolyngbyaceae cyanobacterium RU_5_1]|nr:hypothetical protein [Leptolyngbyaceae cyanobacterium RU_5_1]
MDFVRGSVQPEQVSVQLEQPSEQSELKYTAQQIADRYPGLGKGNKPLGEATIRTRWHDWIIQVCPDESLLKDGTLFTQLASDLFDHFVRQCKLGNLKPDTWVDQARKEFAPRFRQSSTLALPQQLSDTVDAARLRAEEQETQNEEQKSGLLAIIQQYKGLQTNLSDEEIRLAKQRGVKKAIAKLTVELEAETETDAQLRQELLNQ